jgi:hypothetical protein
VCDQDQRYSLVETIDASTWLVDTLDESMLHLGEQNAAYLGYNKQCNTAWLRVDYSWHQKILFFFSCIGEMVRLETSKLDPKPPFGDLGHCTERSSASMAESC